LPAILAAAGLLAAPARTVPLGLANLSIAAEYRTECGMLFAGIVLVTLPILLVYVLLQRQIVRGIAAGVLKG
jgi:ABC-type glycerol-3-phosphate transport system permease component